MRVTTLSLSLLAGLCATAQPVLNFSNLDLIGSSFDVYGVINPGSSDPSADGANITWDFSSATVQLAGTHVFMAPAGTPYAGDYPAANMASELTVLGNTSYTYYNVSTAQLDILAEEVGSADPNIYSEPKTVLQFPYEYNDWFIDDYNEDGTDYSVSRAYMGYGTVILPSGTFTNVVKQASTSGSIDFYTSDPVAHLIHIESGGTIIVQLPSEVGVEENGRPAIMQLFPNPVTDGLTLKSDASLGSWQVIDATGRVLRSGNTGATSTTLDLSDLAPGSYVARIHTNDAARTAVFMKN